MPGTAVAASARKTPRRSTVLAPTPRVTSPRTSSPRGSQATARSRSPTPLACASRSRSSWRRSGPRWSRSPGSRHWSRSISTSARWRSSGSSSCAAPSTSRQRPTATLAAPTSTFRGNGPTWRTCSPPRRVFNGSRWWSRRTGKTVLVTGIDGFAGSHLSDLLLRRRHSVHGTIRGDRPVPRAELAPHVRTHQVDLRDRDRVDSLVREIEPQWVFHLAALSSPAASWDDPAETIATNAGLEANLLAALVKQKPMPRVVVVGSADEYGRPLGRARRLDEATPLRPLTPYGVSKVTQDLLALQYHLSHGLPAIRMRPFNHAGPRQAPHFAVASFAQQIARIELGAQPPVLKVGNLDARRDFTHVRAIVRAYLMAAEKGKPGEVYNVGSGTAPRLRDLVARLLAMTRILITLEVDTSRKHAVEADVYLCDSRRFRRLTGWQPQISLDRTLRDTLEYWRRSERRAA